MTKLYIIIKPTYSVAKIIEIDKETINCPLDKLGETLKEITDTREITEIISMGYKDYAMKFIEEAKTKINSKTIKYTYQ
jgi:hypothetical protein